MIRKLTLKDTAELYAVIAVSKPSLKNLIWAEGATFESTARFIHEKNLAEFPNATWAIETLPQHEIAGCIELREFSDRVQIGYWIGTPFRRMGLVKRAVIEVRNTYFNSIPRTVTGLFYSHNFPKPLTAMIHPENEASKKILEHAGFKVGRQTTDDRGVWDHYTCMPVKLSQVGMEFSTK